MIMIDYLSFNFEQMPGIIPLHNLAHIVTLGAVKHKRVRAPSSPDVQYIKTRRISKRRKRRDNDETQDPAPDTETLFDDLTAAAEHDFSLLDIRSRLVEWHDSDFKPSSKYRKVV